MRHTTHTCDRCKRTGPEKELELWPIYLEAFQPCYPSSSKYRAEWCRPCCVATGLIPEQSNDVDGKMVADVPAPTLEDLIRDIVRNEMQGG